MPNWCDTTYKAVGTKEQVKKFHELAKKSWDNDDNKGWLGHLVTELGGDWEKVHCRGWIRDEPYLRDDFGEEDYAECTLYTDCAWGEMDEWRHFIEKEIDGLVLYYLAIEPGMCEYYTNDDQYADKYYVDNVNDGTDILSEEGTIDYVNNFFGQHFKTIEECINFAGEYGDDNGDQVLWINAIEYSEN